MMNNKKLGYVTLAIIFVLLNVMVFAIPTNKTLTFWITYIFTVLSLGIQIMVGKYTLGKTETLKSRFLKIPIIYVGTIYLVIQIALLIFFSILSTLPVWVALVSSAIVASIFGIGMISAKIGETSISNLDQKISKKVLFIKELQVDVKLLVVQEEKEETKKALQRLQEQIGFSDPMSHEKLMDLENKIKAEVAKLKTATNKEEIIQTITRLLEERNEKCKIYKGEI